MMNLRELLQSYAQGNKSPLRIEARLLNSAEGELLIYGPIVDLPFWEDETSAMRVREQLKQLGDVATVNVHINSPGGLLDQGVAIHNVLKQSKAHIVGWVDGLAASSASVVLAAADEVRMPRNARIMIHDPWSFTIGDAVTH